MFAADSGARHLMSGFRAFIPHKMSKTYIVYLDEFGHIGPYISSTHKLHNTHPVFGLGGFAIPITNAREFSKFFFKLKINLFDAYEIPEARKHAEDNGKKFVLSAWEKKGSKQYSVTNLKKYKDFVTRSTNRIFNKIESYDGFLFYVGEAKTHGIEKHNSSKAYQDCLREVIKRLDDEFRSTETQFLIFMDDHESRSEIVKNAIYEMHQQDKFRLIEAPLQVDSKLYQTIQCADWLCAIYGKIAYYDVEPESKPTYHIFQKYFESRINKIQKRSGVRNNVLKRNLPLQTGSIDKLIDKFNGTT